MRLLVCGLTLLGSSELCTKFPRSYANPSRKTLSSVGELPLGTGVRSSHLVFRIQVPLIYYCISVMVLRT